MIDVLVAGGGPSGLSAALALGRGRKHVLLCDAGPRRNAAAMHVQNFVTRDGTPPDEFRGIARAQLASYPRVEVRDVGVESIAGERGAFSVRLGDGSTVEARRVLLATGMVDEMLPLEGFRELWGRSIFQCPYCHGWEIQDRRWGVLASTPEHTVRFALMARGWTSEVTVFGDGDLALPDGARAQLHAAGVRLTTPAATRLVSRDGQLAAIELADGTSIECDALFAHPPQRQVAMVRALGLALDDAGYVVVDPITRETSIRGIYAAGDLTTRMQAAVVAAAAGMQAGAAINGELTAELALNGAI